MAVPSQNNIAKTIKSQIDEMDKVISIIVKAATSKTIKLSNSKIADIKKYKATIDNMFDSKNGIVTLIVNSTEKLIKIQSNKLPNYRILNRMTRKMFKYINSIADTEIDINKLKTVKDKLEPITEIVTSITSVFDNISKMKIPGLFTTKFLMIKLGLWRITKLSFFLNALNLMAPILVTSKVSLLLLDSITTSIFNIFNNISNTPIGLFTLAKIRLIAFLLKKSMVLVRTIGVIGRYIRATGGLKDALILSAVFNMLESVFDSLKNIKVGIFFRIKLNRITRALLLINKVTRLMSRIKVRPKAFISLLMLRLLFTSFAMLMTVIILITPIVILAMPALAILLLGTWTFAFVVRLIVKIIVRLALRHTMIALLALFLITSMLAAIALAFLFIALVAEPIVKSMLWIVGLLGCIALITFLLGGLGLLIGMFIMPILPFIAIGLLAIVMIIGILFIMALMLKVIEALNLDGDKIAENVRIVIDTTVSIITGIFRKDETTEEESNKSWIASIIDFIGGTLKTVIQAIMSVAFLAVMVVAILMILLIATQLRLIQELDLKKDLINKNVTIVIDTALEVIKLLFTTTTDEPVAGNKTWLQSILDYTGSGLSKIIRAIMAVAFLMMIVIAITCITLIATELRILQEIELDKTIINENVGIVMDTAQSVITNLFTRDEEPDKKSNKGFLIDVINYVSPNLSMIVEAIMAVAFLAVSIFVILLITILAKELKELAEMTLDGPKITENVEIVCSTCDKVISAVHDRNDKPDKKSNKGWIRKLIEWMGADGLVNIIDAIMAMAWLGMSIAIIGMVHTLAKQLSTIDKIKLSNNITKKVDNICKAADQVSAAVQNRKDTINTGEDGKKKGLIARLFPRLAEIAGALSRMRWVSSIISTVGSVNQIVETIQSMEKLPDLNTAVAKVRSVCDTADAIAIMINEKAAVNMNETSERLTLLQRINSTITELSNIDESRIYRSRKALDGHIKFLDKLNTLDVSKLETSAMLFEQIAEFSKSIKGDFDGLAQAMTDELMPLLDSLDDHLRQVGNRVENSTSTLVSQLRNTVNEMNRTITSTQEENWENISDDEAKAYVEAHNKTKLDNEARLDADNLEAAKRKIAADNAAQNDATNLGAKLDLLYDLFSGNGAGTQYAIVKVVSNA